MKYQVKIFFVLLLSFIFIISGIALGSVFIPFSQVLKICAAKIFNLNVLKDSVEESFIQIVWGIRTPRVLAAFISGGALAVSGLIMQSVLKNPLASSYTIGVSSGASLGAVMVIASGFSLPLLSFLTVPLSGLICGLLTVYAAVKFASAADGNLQSNTIILAGIVFSLFINAVLVLITALNKDSLTEFIFWQMGSFAGQSWQTVLILFAIVFFILFALCFFHSEMDILSFGDEQAFSMGVDTYRLKWFLLFASAAATGAVISFAGIIGFIDLIIPHLVRKIFGSKHKRTVPLSFFTGGSLMVLCDLAARSLLPPRELPAGAITALIGAPFFAYVFFKRRK